MCENSLKPIPVAHRGDFNGKVERSAVFAQKLLLNFICVIFITIENNERFRLAFCYLAAKLAAYRASAARNEHCFTEVKIKLFFSVYRKRLSEKQVLCLNFAERALSRAGTALEYAFELHFLLLKTIIAEPKTSLLFGKDVIFKAKMRAFYRQRLFF
jgi:hypothetical protein